MTEEKFGTASIDVDYERLAGMLEGYLDLEYDGEVECDCEIDEEAVVALIEEHTLTEEDVVAIVEEHVPTEEDIMAIVEENAPSGGYGGGGSGNDNGGELPPEKMEQLRALIDRAERVLDEFERKTGLRGVTFHVGPELSSDASMHSNALWGMHFHTEHDLVLGDADTQALQAGTVTFTVYDYSGGDLGEVIDESEHELNGHEQTIHLDLEIPGGSEVLLTRPIPWEMDEAIDRIGAYEGLPEQAFKASDDETAMPMPEYDATEELDDEYGITWYGKGNPVFSGNDIQYWHYLHDLEITADIPAEE